MSVKVVAPAGAVPTCVKLTPSVERSILKPDSLSEPGCQEIVIAAWDVYTTWGFEYLTTCATVRVVGAPRAVGATCVTVTWSKTALAVVPLLWAVRARPTRALVPMWTVCGSPMFCQGPGTWLEPAVTSVAQ